MKVISPIFSSLRGKLGGAVFAVARGGVAYGRSLVIPGNPRTQQQTRIRNILAGLAAFWVSGLSSAQRTAWSAIAPDSSSGIDTFVACNSVLLQGGGARVSAAPVTASCVFTPPATLTILDDWSTTVGALTATDAYNATAGGVLNVYMSAPQSASRQAQQFPFSFLTSKLRAGGAIVAADMNTLIDAAAAARFGATVGVGKVVYVRFTSASVLGSKSLDAIFRVVIDPSV